MNTQEWITKAKFIHNEKYDYELVDYVNRNLPVFIVCPKHGRFQQRPADHLRGIGCRSCSYEKMSNDNSLGTIEFISRSKIIHGNKFDYSKVKYINSNTKVVIICPVHGEFLQIPHNHLQGAGCYKCNIVSLNIDEFIQRARKRHGDKYDYSRVKYVNYEVKVTIICPVHGEFEQRPADHFVSGCMKCSYDSISENLTKDQDTFIKEAKEVHGERYDYSKVKYTNAITNVIITCRIHGDFEQLPNNHLKGSSCPNCVLDDRRLGKDNFIEKASKKHKGKYDYSMVGSINSVKQKTTIICPKHGEFQQRVEDHLLGRGCSNCPSIISIGHQELIDFIDSTGVNYSINNKKLIYPQEIDILIDDPKIGIEFNGLYWHSYNKKESRNERLRHANKAQLCRDINLPLLQFFENEWIEKRSIVKSIIMNKLGLNISVYARKCSIVSLDNSQYNSFMIKNHLQGSVPTHYKYGLSYGSEILCVLGVNRDSKYQFQIMRFANAIGYNVIGGASRLFKKFINECKPDQILTYADCRISNGQLYRNLGFTFNGITSPNYYYVKGNRIYRRQCFQKHKLADRLAIFDSLLSESENMFRNRYRRIWDAGHFRFLWR